MGKMEWPARWALRTVSAYEELNGHFDRPNVTVIVCLY